jgi:hypothetical protein
MIYRSRFPDVAIPKQSISACVFAGFATTTLDPVLAGEAGPGVSIHAWLTQADEVSHPAMLGKRCRINRFARSTGGVDVFRTCATGLATRARR